MRLLRFTTRRLMVLVAVVAVAVAARALWQERGYRLLGADQSHSHALIAMSQANQAASMADAFGQHAERVRMAGDPALAARYEQEAGIWARESTRWLRMAEDDFRRAAQLRLAARYPWLPAPPDPPPPE